MHGNMNVKFVNAKQAKEIYQYRNTREKLYKTNAVIWYNKVCREKHLDQFLPDCAGIRSSKTCLKHTSAECTIENS
jgi:hypothetical protein